MFFQKQNTPAYRLPYLVLWSSQIVCICPYSLNITTAFYFLNEYSNTLQCLFDWYGVSCHNEFVLYLNSTSLGIGAIFCSSVITNCYRLANNTVKNLSVILWFCLHYVSAGFNRRCKTLFDLSVFVDLCYAECVYIPCTSCLLTNKINQSIMRQKLKIDKLQKYTLWIQIQVNLNTVFLCSSIFGSPHYISEHFKHFKENTITVSIKIKYNKKLSCKTSNQTKYFFRYSIQYKRMISAMLHTCQCQFRTSLDSVRVRRTRDFFPVSVTGKHYDKSIDLPHFCKTFTLPSFFHSENQFN